MRNYAENARLCGNMQKITKCAEMCGITLCGNCAENGKLCDPAPIAPNMCLWFRLQLGFWLESD